MMFLTFVMISLLFCSQYCVGIMVGCGGYILSDIPINYSNLKVRLFTVDNTERSHTQVASLGGYFLLPVYEHGKYIIKVDHPPNWYFDPEEAAVDINGNDDPCSKGIEFNFTFRGYHIHGSVLTYASQVGPANVLVQLLHNGTTLKETLTDDLGRYSFSALFIRDFVLRARHPSWKFDKNDIHFTVVEDTSNEPEPIVVSGYNLKVLASNLSSIDWLVELSLCVNRTSEIDSSRFKCHNETQPPSLIEKSQWKCMCCISSDHGMFLYENIPVLTYRLIPVFPNTSQQLIKLNPPYLDVNMTHNDLSIEYNCKVEEIIHIGKAVKPDGIAPVPGADVLLDGIVVNKTDANGEFQFSNYDQCFHEIMINSTDYIFEPAKFRLSSNTFVDLKFIAYRVRVSGAIVIENVPTQNLESIIKALAIRFTALDREFQSVTGVDSNLSFISFLPSAKYNVTTEIKSADMSNYNALQFEPGFIEVHVESSPVDNLLFTQKVFEVFGDIFCLESCPCVTVRIFAISENLRNLVVEKVFPASNSTQLFFNASKLLTGNYTVAIFAEQILCWDKHEQPLNLEATPVNFNFRQTAHHLLIQSSYDLDIHVQEADNYTAIDDFRVTANESARCFNYTSLQIIPSSPCHVFEKQECVVDLTSTNVLAIAAVAHKVTVRVHADSAEENMQSLFNLSLRDYNDNRVIYLKLHRIPDTEEPLEAFLYLPKGRKLSLTLESEKFFIPNSTHDLIVSDDCSLNIVSFSAFLTITLTGKTQPPVCDATVEVYNNEQLFSEGLTGEDGTFHFKRLPRKDSSYEVVITKKGYSFVKSSEDSNVFQSIKHCKLTVEILEKFDFMMQPVLVTISSKHLKPQTIQLSENGAAEFYMLTPGIYFVLPQSRQFKFSPENAIIELKDEEELLLNFQALKIAFAAFGTVNSVNGEPLPSLEMEAVGIDECKTFRETGLTASNGQFSIKDLRCGCTYYLRPYRSMDVTVLDLNSYPDKLIVNVSDGDIMNLDFVAVHRMKYMDVSGRIITDGRYLNYISVSLFSDNDDEQLIDLFSLNTSPFFYFKSIPMDGKPYLIVVDSKYLKTRFSFEPVYFNFIATRHNAHFILKAAVTKKIVECNASTATILGVLIVAAVAIYLQYTK